MNSRLFFGYRLCLALATCLALTAQLSGASELTRLSGSYEVIEKTDAGPNTTVRLRIHVTNQGASSLSVQRMALRNFSHPTRGQVHACTLTVTAGGSADSIQEFTVPRLDYESWQRRSQPELILEILTGAGHRTTEVVPLTRVSSRKGN